MVWLHVMSKGFNLKAQYNMDQREIQHNMLKGT